MTQTPEEFVQTHLAHELEYMLIAATTWCGCHPDRRRSWPRHLVATAEYAAFVHERSLYEFFCESGGAYDARKHVGHPTALSSPLWMKWEKHLNTAVMHLWKRWKGPTPVIGEDHLKDQVADLACDLVRLWQELEQGTEGSVHEELASHRTRILDLAGDTARRLKTPELDWALADPFASWGDRKWWPVGNA
jgi:hypothetical protein